MKKIRSVQDFQGQTYVKKKNISQKSDGLQKPPRHLKNIRFNVCTSKPPLQLLNFVLKHTILLSILAHGLILFCLIIIFQCFFFFFLGLDFIVKCFNCTWFLS